MAADYKYRGRPHASRPPIAGWLWLVTGLLVGLFAAFLVHLSHKMDSVPFFSRAQDSTQQVQKGSKGQVREQEKQAKVPRPRFDFYTILPEMEVVVPDRRLESPPIMPDAAESSQDETFVLQVASLRSAADADAFKARLILEGFDAHVQEVTINSDTWHRVRVGPLQGVQRAREIRRRLQDLEIDAVLLKVKG